MPNLLDAEIQSQVKALFQKLETPVTMLFFNTKKNCQYCAQTEQLLSEIAGLSEKVNIYKYFIESDTFETKKYKVKRTPYFIICEQLGDEVIDHGISFAGIPAGHEFTSLINAIVMVSTHQLQLKESTRKILRNLTKPIDMQVFTTPTCPYCPQAVIMGHQMAMLSPMVTSTMVNAIEFQAEARDLGVQGVPHITINAGIGTLVGAESEEVLLDEIIKVASI